MVEIFGKLCKQFVAHVGKCTTTKLCDFARDGEIGNYGAFCRRWCDRSELSSDNCRRRALTCGVATFPLERCSVSRIIACHKTCLTLELSNDRTNLDLDLTAVRVTLNFGELRAWQAWRDALEVGENYPCVIDWHIDDEFVI